MQGYNSSAKNVLKLKIAVCMIHTTHNSNPEGGVTGFVGLLLHSIEHLMINVLAQDPTTGLLASRGLQTTIPTPC